MSRYWSVQKNASLILDTEFKKTIWKASFLSLKILSHFVFEKDKIILLRAHG